MVPADQGCPGRLAIKPEFLLRLYAVFCCFIFAVRNNQFLMEYDIKSNQIKFISQVQHSAKNCKGDDSTAQGNTKGWGHAKNHKDTLKIQT